MILLGLTKQGLECTGCKSAIHVSCAENYDTPCLGDKSHPPKEPEKDKKEKGEGGGESEGGGPPSNAHQFEVTDFYVPTFCSHCGGLLVGLSKQGCTCKKCEAVVHQKCIPAVPPCFESLESMEARLTFSDVLAMRGLAYYHMSKYDRAIDDLQKALSSQGEDFNESQKAAFSGNLGLAYYYSGSEDEAFRLFNEAIELGLKEEQIFTLRAVIHQLHGRNEEALSDRKQALLLCKSAQLTVFPYPLPPEVISYVFTYLTKKELAIASTVCKRWYSLIHFHSQKRN